MAFHTIFMLMVLNLHLQLKMLPERQTWIYITFSISVLICRNEPDIQKRILTFSSTSHCSHSIHSCQEQPWPFSPIAQMSALILHFFSYPTSNPLTHIVRFSFEMSAESDPFLSSFAALILVETADRSHQYCKS